MKAQTLFFALPMAACILCSAVAAENGVTANPNKAGDGVQVGVSGRDGISVSGGQAFVTRNGATEKLSKDLILPSGVTVQPDGTMILKDGTKANLRTSQLLTFEGKVMELPPDPNENPGGRAAAPQNANSTNASPATTPSATATGNTSGRSGGRIIRNNQGNGGSIFVDGGGNPFMGTLGADGSIITTDGRTIAFDGTVRAVTFGNNGNPALGTINNNGTVTQADGSILFSDGSVRGADGSVTTPPRDAQGNPMRSGIPQNTTNVPLTNANGQPVNTNAQTNPNVPATNNNNNTTGTNTNSPNNTGTTNVGNAAAGGNSTNNTGTVNNPNATGNAATPTHQNGTATGNGNAATGTNRNNGATQAERSSARPSGARNGGSNGGTGTGTGASGAGGASGGGGGGASR